MQFMVLAVHTILKKITILIQNGNINKIRKSIREENKL